MSSSDDSEFTEVRYPNQRGKPGDTRKRAQITYDTSSRLKDLKVGGVMQMDQIAYNDYGQTTSIRIGGGSANPLTEEFSYHANTGNLARQKVKRGSTILMDLGYGYARFGSNGSKNGLTGNLTHIVDYKDRNKDRKYEYDALGRLKKAMGGASAGGTGATANWTQNYTYDRYGNKKATTKSGITANSAAVPLDGLASQAYAATTNRITTSGHEYDHAGNMTRGKAPDGSLQRFEYDAAGRLVKIKTDSGALLEEYLYGADRQRIKKTVANGDKTYYAWGGSSVIAEYTEVASASSLIWAKSYVYAGSRLLSTITKNGASETTEYHHPDRLGTKLVTNTSLNTAKSQSSLPFGTAISSETTATTNQKFTSYDRSGATGLDYAVNRTYNSGQSRFTQVDPIGMASASIGNPQSMNLFAYTQNNPVDFVDPSGLLLEIVNCTGGLYWDASAGNDGRWRTFFECWTETIDTGRRSFREPPEPSDCERFADQIVDLAFNFHTIPAALLGGIINFGRELLGRGYLSIDAKEQGVSAEGFKEALVHGGQGADVYRHLFGHIGATAIGSNRIVPKTVAGAYNLIYGKPWGKLKPNDTGYDLSNRELAADHQQSMDFPERTQSLAEIRDDYAGRQIGGLIRGLFKRGKLKRDDWRDLRRNIKAILCEPSEE